MIKGVLKSLYLKLSCITLQRTLEMREVRSYLRYNSFSSYAYGYTNAFIKVILMEPSEAKPLLCILYLLL